MIPEIVKMSSDDADQKGKKMKLDKDIAKYKKELKDVIENKRITVFPNKGLDESNILMSFILDSAQKDVMIFTNSLNENNYTKTDYIDSLNKCLLKGVKFSFLIDQAPHRDSKIYNTLKEFIASHPGSGEIRQVTPSAIDKIRDSFDNNQYYHFTVADDNKYRLETNSETKESWCSFRHPKVAKRLREIFLQANSLSERKL